MIREIEQHPEQQRTYAELRTEFRTAALERIRDSYTGYHPIGWAMSGDPIYARDRYTAEEWSCLMDRRLREPVTQSFGLDSAPLSLGEELESLAQKSMLHESVTWDASVEGTVDHDAPACADILRMSDDDICAYVESAIEASREI